MFSQKHFLKIQAGPAARTLINHGSIHNEEN